MYHFLAYATKTSISIILFEARSMTQIFLSRFLLPISVRVLLLLFSFSTIVDIFILNAVLEAIIRLSIRQLNSY